MAPCTPPSPIRRTASPPTPTMRRTRWRPRSEEHTSELQSRQYLVCRLLLEKKKHDHNADAKGQGERRQEECQPRPAAHGGEQRHALCVPAPLDVFPDRLHDVHYPPCHVPQ